MKQLTRSLVLLCAVITVGCAHGPHHSRPQSVEAYATKIDRIAERAISEGGIVGLSIAIAQGDDIVYAKGFGHIDADASIPANAETIYDIASVGKQFTAAAIMKLVERGDLSLGTPVRELVPELPANFPNPTIEQLLRHTSGFIEVDLDELEPPEDASDKRYGLELLTDASLVGGQTHFRPGETWVYCNPGYLILGIVVEVVSGSRYDDFIREELLSPVGLTDMRVCERAEFPRMSQALRRTESGVDEVPFIDMTYYTGQGSVCSSATDLVRWGLALKNGEIITPESLALMRSHTELRGDEDTALVPYGFAQRMGRLEGHARVGHSGTFDGGSAILFEYPDDDLAIAVIANTRGLGAPHAARIETDIAKAILGIASPDPRSLEMPLTEEAKRRIRGTYFNGKTFTADFEGNDLIVSSGGKQLERLVHIGSMRFRNAESPDTFEWFHTDGDHAGWWVYSESGNFLEVLRRR